MRGGCGTRKKIKNEIIVICGNLKKSFDKGDWLWIIKNTFDSKKRLQLQRCFFISLKIIKKVGNLLCSTFEIILHIRCPNGSFIAIDDRSGIFRLIFFPFYQPVSDQLLIGLRFDAPSTQIILGSDRINLAAIRRCDRIEHIGSVLASVCAARLAKLKH